MLKIETPRQYAQLHSGDRMTREEFHRIYQQMPEDFKAELIGGIVYVASPMRLPHGKRHVAMSAVLAKYESETPGVEGADNSTLLLGDESEPQPDLFMRILPECGGQSSTTADEYLLGAPELVIEIAHSSYAIDLHGKRGDYVAAGVLEYLVVNLHDRRLHWFDLSVNQQQSADDGIFRMRTMPGLWIHEEGLLAKDYRVMMATLDAGLASDEHQAFVAKLKSQRGK